MDWTATRSGSEVSRRECKLSFLQAGTEVKQKIFGCCHIVVAIGLPHWKGSSYMSLFVASDSLSLSSVYVFLII